MSRSIPMRMLPPAIVLVLWGTGLFLQPYSTPSRRDYQRQAQFLFRAALEHDSLALAHASSPELAARLLKATDQAPSLIQAWSRNARPHHDVHAGDTTFVWFTTPAAACTRRPLAMGFVRSPGGLRTISLFTTCPI